MYLCPLRLTQIIVILWISVNIYSMKKWLFSFTLLPLTENSCWAEFGGYQTAALGSQKQPGQGHWHPGDAGIDLTASDRSVWVVIWFDDLVVAENSLGPEVFFWRDWFLALTYYWVELGIFFILATLSSLFHTTLSSCLFVPFYPYFSASHRKPFWHG